MRYTILVNLPLSGTKNAVVYKSTDRSIMTSERSVLYPVLAYLECAAHEEDEIRFVFLAKKGPYSRSGEYIQNFCDVWEEINQKIGAETVYRTIESEFREQGSVHEKLMRDIVEQIEEDTNLIADITFGPKDLPIIVFTALEFAERFLNCRIEHILYGQGVFNDQNKLEQTEICDMIPLYTLNTLTGHLTCKNSEQARQLLRTIVGE